MLFDLRSRGRRRAIQAVYLFLAVLIGGGLVLFGVGGGASSTGVLSGLAQNGGGGSATGLKIYEADVTKTAHAAEAAPQSAAAWAAYASAAYNLATTGNNYVAATSSTAAGFTSSGAKVLDLVATAWNHYLSLAPAHPDPQLAGEVANAFGGSGVSEWAIAESAQEIVAEDDASNYAEYADLAEDAYFAHEIDRAKLAAAKALSLAPKSQLKTLKADFAAIAAQASKSSTGASGTTGSSG
jgi:hypothetical protein